MYTSRFAYFAPADVGSGGTDTGSSQDAGTTEQNDQQQTTEKSQKSSVEPFAKLWHTGTDDEKKTTTEQETAQPQPGQQTTQDQDFVKKHIEGMRLTEDIDVPKIVKDLEDGQNGSLLEAFNTVGARAWENAVKDSHTLIRSEIAKAKQEIISETKSSVSGNMAVQDLNSKFEFTQNPAIAPIAQVVLAQLLSTGVAREEAVKQTGEFFKHMHKLSAKELGIQTPPNSQPGAAGFSGSGPSMNGTDESGKTESWVDLLSAKAPN